MALEFTKGTDQKHQIKLDSAVMAANWVRNRVVAGGCAEVEVQTAFVGGGAPIVLTARTEDGKEGGKLEDTIRYNRYRGAISLKDDLPQGALLYFEVELKGSGGATGRSNSVPVLLPPKISKLAWSQAEVQRGDIVTLSAEVKDVPIHTPCAIDIFEYSEDGAHDKLTTIAGEVLDQKLELHWRYDFGEETAELPTKTDLEPYGNEYAHPEYFFVVDIYGFRVGDQQESGRLRFKDYIEFRFDGKPSAAGDYEVVLTLPDGNERTATFDDNGYARFDDVPPGPCRVQMRRQNDGE